MTFEALWTTLPIPGEFDAMDACDQERWRGVVRLAFEHSQPANKKLVVGYMVHGTDIAQAALYPLAQKAEAFDAAHRWNKSITALAFHPDCPDA